VITRNWAYLDELFWVERAVVVATATARHGLGQYDARRVGSLTDAAEVAPARDLLDEHLVTVRVKVRVRVWGQ